MAWISGVGLTAFGRQPGATALQWQEAAAVQALEDADVTAGAVDGVLAGYATTSPHLMPANLLAELLGLRPRTAFGMSVGGATGLAMVCEAVRIVESGAARCVLVVAGEDRASGQSTDDSMRTLAQVGHRDYEVPVGANVPAYYALLASAYLHRHRLDPTSLAPLAVQMRAHAHLHPGAHFRAPLQVEDVLASKPVATPLRLLDCCPVSDGGAAVVVTADQLSPRSVRVAGLGQAHLHQHLTEADFDNFGAGVSAARALRDAGAAIDDIDVAGVYDSFTITLALLLEEIGLAGQGRAGALAAEGHFDRTGRLPLNTHGGLLSYGHSGVAGGMAHLVEVTAQLRGEAGDRQVERALRRGLVHADGGVMSAHVTAVLESPARTGRPATKARSASAEPSDPTDESDAVAAGAQEQQSLVFRSCCSCGHRWYFERRFCPHCGAGDTVTSATDGIGTVVAATTVHRAPAGSSSAQVPFEVVLVDLDEGVRVMGRCEVGTPVGARVALAAGVPSPSSGADPEQWIPFFEVADR
jgi:acetyl-CoA acetyltransferase/uncharacterized OB-fold protein